MVFTTRTLKALFQSEWDVYIGGVLRIYLTMCSNLTVSEFYLQGPACQYYWLLLIGVVYSFAEQSKMTVAWRLFIKQEFLAGLQLFGFFNGIVFGCCVAGYYGMMVSICFPVGDWYLLLICGFLFVDKKSK